MEKKHYLTELKKPSKLVKKGQKSADAKRVQEWLNLWKFYDSRWNQQIIVDGDFGPASEKAVKNFQAFRGLTSDGTVGAQTWKELVKPMQEAFNEITFYASENIRQRVVAYANQQEKSQPTELNDNEGPWVRAYMDGNEGSNWFWCVGFVETVLDLAYSSLGLSFRNYFPNPSDYSCDKVLEYARNNSLLVGKQELLNKTYIPAEGDMFLLMNPNNTDDATHIGFVVSCEDTILTTIEGNTDDHEGSRNGGEVCKRTRNFSNHLIYIVKLKY